MTSGFENFKPVPASVVAVQLSPVHAFSKQPFERIHLLAGLGVEGDAHCGATVKHRSRVKRDPSQPNLRQVHLMALELLHSLQAQGFRVQPGSMGENITTSGLELLALPRDTRIKIGSSAELQITGLRNPCAQLDTYQPGLMQAVLEHDSTGALIRKAGVMAIVLHSGWVQAGDKLQLTLPPEPWLPLEPV